MSLQLWGVGTPARRRTASALTLSSAAACMVALLTPLHVRAATYTGTNTTTITANTGSTTSDSVSSTDLYPSAITFSGIPSTEHIVSMVLTMNGFSATDTNALMAAVALQGSTQSINALLFDGPGDVGNTATNLTLSFDPTSANHLPTTGTFSSGVYAPDFDNTGYEDVLPLGNTPTVDANLAAPQTLSDAYPSNFDAFSGTNPNGTYLLYLNDFYPNNTASIARGWSLTITTDGMSNATSAPEPSSFSLVSLSLVGGVASFGRLRRRRQRTPEKQGE